MHVTDKLYQTLPLYSSLGTTGVYVHADDFDIAGRRATITAETQVKNEHARTETCDYQVAIVDPDGRTVKTIDSGSHTIADGETKTMVAITRVDYRNFRRQGLGFL